MSCAQAWGTPMAALHWHSPFGWAHEAALCSGSICLLASSYLVRPDQVVLTIYWDTRLLIQSYPVKPLVSPGQCTGAIHTAWPVAQLLSPSPLLKTLTF